MSLRSLPRRSSACRPEGLVARWWWCQTAVWFLAFAAVSGGYEALQGPTEVLFWDKARALQGYTWFGVRGTTYLLDMEGRVVHTWPVGTNPHLLPDGGVLDASKDDPSGFGGLKEVDWDGATVWQYMETRTNYVPHHDFLRIHNPRLNAGTTLYLANKTISSNQCIQAGCSLANARSYTNAQMDAIVEVDRSGTIVWEWWFFDHVVQDVDATKSNYVGVGRSVSNYPGRLNLNIPGLPVQRDWLHCNSIDYNEALDQIVINSVRGEFYVIDHGATFVPGNPGASIALASGARGDFLYRFGDPARYNRGNPPSILTNWTVSTTGNKQVGGAHHATWIPPGIPGAGHFLVFNNAQNLFEHTQSSSVLEIQPGLDVGGTDTGVYVDPAVAGYRLQPPAFPTSGQGARLVSRQVVWSYAPKSPHGMFSQIGGSAQRLPNGNTFVCSDTEGHLFEVTSGGEVVWEYINPVTSDGIRAYKRDNWPMYNSVFRAFRITPDDPAVAGRVLKAGNTLTGRVPGYVTP